MTVAAGLAQIDFTDLDNFASGFPHALFQVHRREAPVYWHQPTDNPSPSSTVAFATTESMSSVGSARFAEISSRP